MSANNFQILLSNISLTKTGFIFYSPISIFAFPVTLLVINPGESLLKLTSAGLAITIIIFFCYLPFVWMSKKLESAAPRFIIINFLTAIATIGALRGFLFFTFTEFLSLQTPGNLPNRILASTATTFFWLGMANIVINFSRTFKIRYQQSLNKFVKRNLDAFPSLMPSNQSKFELVNLQSDLSNSLAAHIENYDSENLRELAELLRSKINVQLRPLSKRIWLRSLGEYPVIRYQQMLRDSIQFLDFSRQMFFGTMLFLSIANNFLIRTFVESLARSIVFFTILVTVTLLFQHIKKVNNYLFLSIVGIAPVVGSEYISNLLGYTGSWTATAIIIFVAPALMVILSLFKLTLRDHELIIELLENFDIRKNFKSSKFFDPGERQLASYLHNSLQSELLALSGQLEEAASSNDKEKSAIILQRVASLINRSFVDDFNKFVESPIERLELICKSWIGILDIQIDIPATLLNSPSRNAVIVQTIEEFAANSYRHGKATCIIVTAEENSIGLTLTLHSNGVDRIAKASGLGSAWLDQVAITPWKMHSNHKGTTLEITL